MKPRTTLHLAALVLALSALSCATAFSPEMMREEIRRQSGTDPLRAFELDLGRFTTLVIKSALAAEDGELPFRGLESLQLATWEVASEAGPAIDVTRIAVRGWEQALRAHDPKRSGMVLLRRRGEAIGDLVVVGAGPRKVVYARLQGRLNPRLPQALSGVLQEGGPEEVQRVLSELGGGSGG